MWESGGDCSGHRSNPTWVVAASKLHKNVDLEEISKLHYCSIGDLNSNYSVIIIITSLFDLLIHNWPYQRSKMFERIQCVQRMLNAEPDHWSSSAYTPNVEPDHGPVHEKSGSNCGSEPDFRITNSTHILSVATCTPTCPFQMADALVDIISLIWWRSLRYHWIPTGIITFSDHFIA